MAHTNAQGYQRIESVSNEALGVVESRMQESRDMKEMLKKLQDDLAYLKDKSKHNGILIQLLVERLANFGNCLELGHTKCLEKNIAKDEERIKNLEEKVKKLEDTNAENTKMLSQLAKCIPSEKTKKVPAKK